MIINPRYHFSAEKISNELDIILKARKDPASFGPLYSAYYQNIYKFVFMRVRNNELCADLTQDVFATAITKLHQYESRGIPFSAWLYRIAYTTLQMYFRSGKANRVVSLDDESISRMVDETTKEFPGDDGDVNKVILQRAIQELDDEEVAILELRYSENRTYKEIEQILTITANNARVKMNRILKKLQSQFSQNEKK